VKGKLSLQLILQEDVWWSEGVAPHALNIGARWRWIVSFSFTSRPHYPRGKSLRYSLDRRLGGLQNRSGCGGKKKKSTPLPGIEPRSSGPWPNNYTDWAPLTPVFHYCTWNSLLHVLLYVKCIFLRVSSTGTEAKLQWNWKHWYIALFTVLLHHKNKCHYVKKLIYTYMYMVIRITHMFVLNTLTCFREYVCHKEWRRNYPSGH
jgi:hypothetical protein